MSELYEKIDKVKVAGREAYLQKNIIKYVNEFKNNNPHLSKYIFLMKIKSTNVRGASDLILLIKGGGFHEGFQSFTKAIFIEVKDEKIGRLTQSQKLFLKNVENAGATSYVVNSIYNERKLNQGFKKMFDSEIEKLIITIFEENNV